MISVDFYITTSYSILSVIMYCLVAYTIVKNKKVFSGSYYNIILVDSAVNVYTYLNSLVTLRLPRITCKDCLLAPLMAKMPGLNFFGCMFNHLAYVQYLMILSLIFNRFTAVIFPFQYKAVWKRLFFPLMLFNILGPFAFTYHYFVVTVSLAYSVGRDAFALASEPDVNKVLNVYLIPSMIVLTLLSTALMIATFIVYISNTQRTAEYSVETKLLVYNVIYFLIQLTATVDVIVLNIGVYYNMPILTIYGSILLPYVSDALTFSSPYILLFCSSTLRVLLKKTLLGKISKHNEVSVVTVT